MANVAVILQEAFPALRLRRAARNAAALWFVERVVAALLLAVVAVFVDATFPGLGGGCGTMGAMVKCFL
jgi:hypothetical protein